MKQQTRECSATYRTYSGEVRETAEETNGDKDWRPYWLSPLGLVLALVSLPLLLLAPFWFYDLREKDDRRFRSKKDEEMPTFFLIFYLFLVILYGPFCWIILFTSGIRINSLDVVYSRHFNPPLYRIHRLYDELYVDESSTSCKIFRIACACLSSIPWILLMIGVVT